ncbi:MAG: hypothetical protein ACHQDC_08310, partial [Acidimicrobiales bacterium]
KARAATRFLRRRAEGRGLAVEEWHEEYFGVNAFGGATVDRPASDEDVFGEGTSDATAPDEREPPEVLARLVWRCGTREEAASLGREVGLLGLGGPPMITPFGRGRDTGPTQLLALDALAVDRDRVDAGVRVSLETT